MIKIFGVDISEHNGYVDFNKMKTDGVQFVMLRASWGHFVEDKLVRRNVEECKRIGLAYGFYHYSYADSDANAKIEATSFLSLCKELGGYTYPLCLDMEDADHWKANHGVDDRQNIRTIQIFREVIEEAGEYLILYMSKSWFDRLKAQNAKLIDSIDAWLAHWGIQEPSMNCGMWQYSSDGVISGSSARTDVNWCYKDYPAILAGMKNASSTIQPNPTPEDSKQESLLTVGDHVRIKASAIEYVTGEKIPNWVKERTYTILQIRSGKVLLQEIMSWVYITDVEDKKSISTKLFLGKTVYIKTSALTYATGEHIPNWVKGKPYKILQIGEGKVLLKEIMSWVLVKDIN